MLRLPRIAIILNMNASVWISISGLALYLVVWGVAQRQHRAMKNMTEAKRATGTCNAMLSSELADSASARISLDKEFHGALEGSSKRELMNVSDHEIGSRHMLVERVTGTLHGRSGGFVLRYSGITDDGTSFVVVPGSGTGDLNGISGTMTIRMEHGEHLYNFEYTLNASSSRQASLPQSMQADPDEQAGHAGRIVRSVLPIISVLANQRVAIQRVGIFMLHAGRAVQR